MQIPYLMPQVKDNLMPPMIGDNERHCDECVSLTQREGPSQDSSPRKE